MMTNKDSSAAGIDNRPPMLEENDYESWRSHIERYIKGKPHGKLILKSIQNGPTPHPQTTDLAPEGGAVSPPRNKRDEEFTKEDNRNELTDIQAINILSQGFPKRKYVTHVKNNMNMSTVTYVELFTHLRTYEEHALRSLKKKEQSSAVVDPLAYLAKTTPTHSTTLPATRRAPGNTRTKGIQTTGSGVNNSGKKWYHDKALLMQAKEKGAVLDAEAEAFLADVESVLQRMHTEIAGYVRVNNKHKLVNATLTDELERCKIEMRALERNKVKHDLDMTIVERNKQNAELEEENVMLKLTLKSKVMSIENLQQESKYVLSEKKTLEDKYLEEIVVLTHANKVATNVLKGLGYSNPSYGKQARIAQPALNDRHVLLNPNHPPTRVHDSEESLVHAEVCKIKMAERPGHALPINYAKLNAIYDQFVPQKELSREQVHWLPAAEIASQSSTPAKHVAPFVYTRPIKSDVHKKVWKIQECITAFKKIIMERTAPPPSILSNHRLWNHTKECFDE
nr:hypothetical protein [Tanacetum cinerariifolium]